MPLLDELRRQLKVYRAEKNLDQADIAAMLDINQSMISAFETGSKNLGPDKVERLMGIMGLGLITHYAPARTGPPPLMHDQATAYQPRREVPAPSPEQLEFALDAARSLGDEETTKALQEMQIQILCIIEELRGIGDGYSRHLRSLEQLKFESQHRPKDAVDY